VVSFRSFSSIISHRLNPHVKRPDSKGTVEDVLRPGNEMVAAGYTMQA